MFGMFRKQNPAPTPSLPPDPPASVEYKKDDSLNKVMTTSALQLINGEGGLLFRDCFIAVFKNEPRLIENVDSEYREALINLIDSQPD